MQDDTSFESRLLRVLLGQMHALLVRQVASERFEQPYQNLTDAQKSELGSAVWTEVLLTAYEINTNNTLTAPKTPPPSTTTH
jgi:hypothetical protein